MKTTLFALALAVALPLSAAANQKPAASRQLAGNNDLEKNDAETMAPSGIPPALCDPCIFYGGDLNPNDPSAAAYSDENTLLIAGSSTYANFNVFPGATATITGILFNIQASANFNPVSATYDIRSGVTEGNGGTSLASGSGGVLVAATGRNFLGLNEYSLAVNLSTPLTLGPGAYWINLTPNCTNGAVDGSCSVGRFLFSNTTQRTNNLFGGAQGNHLLYINSPFFGYTWFNWCDPALGLRPRQCEAASFGLMGSAK